MTERTEQRGDPEIANCHICGKRFPTQEELSRHLMEDHDGDTLEDAHADATGDEGPSAAPRTSDPF
jgi:hypothetical protein